MMLQLNPSIEVLTNSKLADGNAIMIIDYGPDVNTVWVVRHKGGIIKHYYSDDIRVYGNPMDGQGWDVDAFDTVKKLPPGAKRNMDFIKKKTAKQKR